MMIIIKRLRETYEASLYIYGQHMRTVEDCCPDAALRKLNASDYVTVLREYDEIMEGESDIKTMATQ